MIHERKLHESRSINNVKICFQTLSLITNNQ